MFALCAGKCAVCGCGDGCLAGGGDDDFFLASKDEIIHRLRWNEYPGNVEFMISTLEKQYGCTFDRAEVGGMQGPNRSRFLHGITDDEIKAIMEVGFDD